MSETGSIVRPLLLALRASGIECHRIHSGKVKSRGGGWLYLGPEGQPDIGGHLPGGRAFYIEGKSSHRDTCKCESCAAQRETRHRIEASGALYVLARSVEEGMDGLRVNSHRERLMTLQDSD